MTQLNKLNTNTKCPECGVNNNCSVSCGKSIQSCWCYSYPIVPVEDNKNCMCSSCLKGVKSELKA